MNVLYAPDEASCIREDHEGGQLWLRVRDPMALFSLQRPGACARVIKRAFDFTTAVSLLLFVAPLLLFIGILIKCTSCGPLFEKEVRVGRGGRQFTQRRFRVTAVPTLSLGVLAGQTVATPQLTRAGRIVKGLRLDHLPIVLNILCGEMSWIGPEAYRRSVSRILRTRLPGYILRLEMRPGITGWAQLHGHRFTQTWDVRRAGESLSYDLYYWKRHSFAMDLSILGRTFFGFPLPDADSRSLPESSVSIHYRSTRARSSAVTSYS